MNPITNHCLAAVLLGGVLTVPSYSPAKTCNGGEAHSVKNKKNTLNTISKLKSEYAEKRQIVEMLAEQIDTYYFNLLEMDESQIRGVMLQNGLSENSACESALRGFEKILKVRIKQEDMPDVERDEMTSYLRSVANARSAIARLNDLTRQLFAIPKTFESAINFDGLKALSEYTTHKATSGDYSFTG